MFCTKCGKQLPEGVKFCTGCGKPIPNVPRTNDNNDITFRQQGQNNRQNDVWRTPDKRKQNIGPIIAIGIVALFVVIGLVVLLVLNGNNGGALGPSSTVNRPISTAGANSQRPSQPDNMRSSAASPERQSKDYVLEYSSTRIYTDEEIKKLSKDELRIARNEIYARRGRKFKDAELQNYFNSKPWYHGTIEPDKFNDNSLSDIEKKNRDLIQKYENKSGS